MSTLELIASDFRKHRRYGASSLGIIFMTQGYWAVLQYRIAHWCYTKIRIQPFRAIVLTMTLLWQKLIEIITGIMIPASAQIGHSFFIGHFGGIIINPEVVIGSDCNISQGVTIGISGKGVHRGTPIIGDRVYIGPNSVVAGKIIVGNDVLVGACTLVKNSIENNCVVLGVPAQVISHSGSNGYI